MNPLKQIVSNDPQQGWSWWPEHLHMGTRYTYRVQDGDQVRTVTVHGGQWQYEPTLLKMVRAKLRDEVQHLRTARNPVETAVWALGLPFRALGQVLRFTLLGLLSFGLFWPLYQVGQLVLAFMDDMETREQERLEIREMAMAWGEEQLQVLNQQDGTVVSREEGERRPYPPPVEGTWGELLAAGDALEKMDPHDRAMLKVAEDRQKWLEVTKNASDSIGQGIHQEVLEEQRQERRIYSGECDICHQIWLRDDLRYVDLQEGVPFQDGSQQLQVCPGTKCGEMADMLKSGVLRGRG